MSRQQVTGRIGDPGLSIYYQGAESASRPNAAEQQRP